MRGLYRDLVVKYEGKKPLGRPRHRKENNIKVFFHEVGCGGMDGIEMAQDREQTRVNAVVKLRIP
jgi:hypothetical protein